MRWREKYPELRPNEISYKDDGLIVRSAFHPMLKARLQFVRALQEFENEEINTFETMPNGSRIQVDTRIGDDVKIGNLCTIGGYGFGYEKDDEGKAIRMPHLSFVEIQDSVVIHNSVNIDRGVLTPTVIGEGTVIDSLVHVAHGAVIGKGCALVSGCVIGGSVVLGDNVFVGMNASIKQKVKVGRNVTIGAGAVVTKDVPDGWTVIGNPAKRFEK